jgi:hypothetical protein
MLLPVSAVIEIMQKWGEHKEAFHAAVLHRAYCEDNIVILFVGLIVAQYSGM